MYSSIIIEDERIFAQQLSGFLEQTTLFAPPVFCQSAMEALALLSTTKFDLIFLDYDLPDMTGLDMLRALPQTSPVILVTVHPEPAAESFDLDSVVDYLIKPYGFPRFLRAMRRALGKLNSRDATIEPTAPAPVNNKKHIYLKTGRKQARFVIDDIEYAEAYGPYVKIHNNQGWFAINDRLSTLETELPATSFLRIHKSYIANINHVIKLDVNHVQIGATKLPIGITYRPAVMQFMKDAGLKNGKP